MGRSLPYDPVEGSRQTWIEQGWHFAAAGVAAVVSVLRAEQIFVNQANEILRPFGLTFARYQVLGVVRRAGPLPLGELGDLLWITPATVTSAIDRLEAAGLIRRVPHPSDGRATLAKITARGARVFDRAVEEMNVKLFGALTMSDEELEQLVGLIGKIRTGVGDVVGVLSPHQTDARNR